MNLDTIDWRAFFGTVGTVGFVLMLWLIERADRRKRNRLPPPYRDTRDAWADYRRWMSGR